MSLLTNDEILLTAASAHRHGINGVSVRGMRGDWEAARLHLPASHPMFGIVEQILRASPPPPPIYAENRDAVLRGAASSQAEKIQAWKEAIDAEVRMIEAYLLRNQGVEITEEQPA